mmetsp:Transcript_9176/g.23786  ORF Transcript_9176/g.23786 Transcript_9176/m.23786 type:complete len:296 (-) Transcript_9176:65-952(-)
MPKRVDIAAPSELAARREELPPRHHHGALWVQQLPPSPEEVAVFPAEQSREGLDVSVRLDLEPHLLDCFAGTGSFRNPLRCRAPFLLTDHLVREPVQVVSCNQPPATVHGIEERFLTAAVPPVANRVLLKLSPIEAHLQRNGFSTLACRFVAALEQLLDAPDALDGAIEVLLEQTTQLSLHLFWARERCATPRLEASPQVGTHVVYFVQSDVAGLVPVEVVEECLGGALVAHLPQPLDELFAVHPVVRVGVEVSVEGNKGMQPTLRKQIHERPKSRLCHVCGAGLGQTRHPRHGV